MEISSGISFFGTGYTEQASQTRYAKAASRYESEGISAGGGSSDSDSTEEIQAKIAALQSQLQAALSGGNTSKASSLQAQIAALQAQVQSAA